MATDFLPNWVLNDMPFKSDTVILVTGWMGHVKWMKYTLESYRKTGKFVLLAFDTHIKYDDLKPLHSGHFPPVDVLALPHAVVLKHATWDADKRNGWLWNFLYAASVISSFSNFRHILTINSDCAFDRPEGVDELIAMLGDGDYMSQSVEYDVFPDKPKSVHTCSMLFRRAAFIRVADYFRDAMKTAGPESYSPELLLVEAHEKLGLKLTPTPQCPIFPDWHDFKGSIDHYQSYNEDSTWKEVLGFRNLCAENDTAGIERLTPLPGKYFDLRDGGRLLPGYERDSLLPFYESGGDMRCLWKFWDEDEDSWYDRRHYPIEHYGSQPIYATQEDTIK
jgi:hypothetical protein